MCCCWSNNNIRRNRYVNDVAIGGNGVASLRPSIFREKLPPTQQQHAQQQQPMHAPNSKTSKTTEQTAAAAARKLTRISISRPDNAVKSTPCRSTIRLPSCAHRHRVSSSRSHNSNTRSNNNPYMPRTAKHQNKKQTKQLQLQHANSQEKGTEALQGTALLAGQRFDCLSVPIDIS